ncbi:uncharacterized protein EV420DRAFT_1130046 [Desarmillaria tabescens]|uniref:Alpha/beta hydrolase fold-3 domain-containing protein n=1 Tax=Armillaria tabescens TaxID=1929756 RepID=A0AA39JDP9_ARMTA|nr:uncharacterized protein EV420DRAFT_1130046 [Desarmillaria tabescens]KAK0440887.1 hypothetical protein EV420DRAFT_1130046 [Desarmillaria tabescens]
MYPTAMDDSRDCFRFPGMPINGFINSPLVQRSTSFSSTMLTVLHCLEVGTIAVILPFYVLGRLAASFFSFERHKTWRAVCTHALFRLIAGHATFVRLILGPTSETYVKWTKNIGVLPTIEPLPDGAELLWIGHKRVDKVILYAHGGAYLFGCGPSFMQFFRHLQLELEKRNVHTGIVLLAYRLVPGAVYPSQLIDAKQALEHLFKAGIQPQYTGLSRMGKHRVA